MADICLSPVLGLRCLGLSHIEEALTLVPIGLEVIFSLGLVFAGRDAGRYVHGLCEPVVFLSGTTSHRIRYLLAAEAPVLLLLAVFSFLGHVVPVFQNNLTPFEALDITIGAHSAQVSLPFSSPAFLYCRQALHPFYPYSSTQLSSISSI